MITFRQRFVLGLCALGAWASIHGIASAAQDAAPTRCPPGVVWTDEVVAEATGMDLAQLERVKRGRALDNASLCDMPEAALRRAIWRADNPKPDHPGEWARFRALQQSDENGRVRPDGLLRAIAARKQILERSPRARATSGTAPTGTFSTSSLGTAGSASGAAWTSIGPGNIGGRVRALLIHPTVTSTVWAGSVAGGIWKTADAGLSWSPVNDFMANLSVSSLVMSPSSTSVMYAGTGEGFYNGDAVRGAGVFKSTDAGVTWNQIASTSPTASSDWFYVNRLAIHPTATTDVLLAATQGGLYRSVDAGATWTEPLGGRFLDVRFDPLNGNNAVAAPSSGAVRYSRDGGATWSSSNLSSSGRVELAYSRQANVVYASADMSSGQVYRSADGGATWTLQGTPQHLGQQGWYDNTIWVDPVNSDHLIVGGIDLYRSTNAGLTWSKISLWYDSRSVHADQHVIVSSPTYDGTTDRRVYFGNDGGVYRANDISAVTQTSGWTNLNNGLAITQFYSGAGHAGTNGRIIGGTQDNYSLVYAGTGTQWKSFFGGDGGFSAIDPTDGNYIYGEYVYLQIHRSTNGGSSQGSYIYSGISDAGSGSTANFIAPFMLDPNNPNVMLAGGLSLWRSSNVKASSPAWSRIHTGSGSNISQIAVAPGNSSIIWIGKNNGELYKTTSGTLASPIWNKLAGTPGRGVLSILIDKDNPQLVYVGLAGYSTSNLWRSLDGGSSWTSIGGGLPPSPIRTVQRHPADARTLYVGTEVGIFTSFDGGVTWTTTNDGPANVSVDQLFWLDTSTLVAATHGRGMLKATMVPGSGYPVAVTKAGTGSGTVSSNLQPGINCGTTCSGYFSVGSSLTLTATAAQGSEFTGWSGTAACTGTSPCTVGAESTVTATFNRLPAYTISVTRSGSGTVTSSPSGIACGATCSASFVSGTSVTLTATPASGYVFSGWSGACNVTSGNACTVLVSGAASVVANFSPAPGYVLTVSKAGAGAGSVSSNPAGISCGAQCTASYAAGTKVTLTPNAASGSAFAGWSGACTGTSPKCTVTMTSARNATASFRLR